MIERREQSSKKDVLEVELGMPFRLGDVPDFFRNLYRGKRGFKFEIPGFGRGHILLLANTDPNIIVNEIKATLPAGPIDVKLAVDERGEVCPTDYTDPYQIIFEFQKKQRERVSVELSFGGKTYLGVSDDHLYFYSWKDPEADYEPDASYFPLDPGILNKIEFVIKSEPSNIRH